jgi:hypothetical protein
MERITLTTIAILLFAFVTKAQITKGSTFIGGQISGGKQKFTNGLNSQEQNALFISPAIGTAIKQNLIAGVDLTYSHSKSESTGNPVNEGNGYGAGFFLRRYAPIANRFYFFLQGRAGFSHDKNESSSGSNQYSSNSNYYNLGLYPGVSFAITKSLHVEAGLNNLVLLSYSHGKSKQSGYPDQTSNGFNFSTSASGSNLSFALRFIIPKK